MKVGFLGGMILLVLTLVFSYVALQNNKLAREITIQSFGVNPQPAKQIEIDVNVSNSVKDVNTTSDISNNSSSVETIDNTQKQASKVEEVNDKWKKFDEKFEDFDKKFENF